MADAWGGSWGGSWNAHWGAAEVIPLPPTPGTHVQIHARRLGVLPGHPLLTQPGRGPLGIIRSGGLSITRNKPRGPQKH